MYNSGIRFAQVELLGPDRSALYSVPYKVIDAFKSDKRVERVVFSVGIVYRPLCTTLDIALVDGRYVVDARGAGPETYPVTRCANIENALDVLRNCGLPRDIYSCSALYVGPHRTIDELEDDIYLHVNEPWRFRRAVSA
jgi:hypothetical protein